MLETRLKHKSNPSELPKEFIKKVADLFNEQFANERSEADFHIFGNIYPQEVILCVSLCELNRLQAGSIYTSVDVPKDVANAPDKVTEFLKHCVDLSASWFAQCFEEYPSRGLDGVLESISELERQWQMLDWENCEIYVRVDKTNHALESVTDKFLSDSENN